MEFSADQQKFLQLLASRIPKLFDAISQGNVKSEYIIGVRRIGCSHVRLKLVAEVVDPGANPLATHGTQVPSTQVSSSESFTSSESYTSRSAQASQLRQSQSVPPARPRRRPRKRHEPG